MMLQTWLLPIVLLAAATLIAFPLSRYMVWSMDGKYRPWAALGWFEKRLDSGPQDWKEYCKAFLLFNAATFVVGFLVMTLQPYLPLNPDHRGMLSATTILHSVVSFMTNTNQQHYSGEVHFSYFTQLFFVCWKQVLSPVLGLAALLAVIRGLRGDKHMGNFYLDMWRGVAYFFVPLCFIVGVLLIAGGVPMTFEGAAQVTTLEPGAMGATPDGHAILTQAIARGPVAAIVAVKQFGTNGGGYFAVNSAHPFENPNEWINFLTCLGLFLIPLAQLIMFGKMLKQYRHAAVIFGVMLTLSVATIIWAVYWDTGRPNPGLTAQAGHAYQIPNATAPGGKRDVTVAAVAGLPVDQSLGNLEGKELRFGISAGPTWAALTTNTSNGSVNSMHDSLNPLAGLVPLIGMMLNCIWGGVGVGLINLLIFLIVGVFIAGLMVGRTPEYLGKKVEGHEIKLASIALLTHPLLILLTSGLFLATSWGMKAESNPGAHGFSQIVYEFTSASANNGSGFEGLGDTWGFNKAEDNPSPPAPTSRQWDIACSLVMLFSRFIPIIAPIAFAASLAKKKPTPFTSGTMRTDTLTFGFLLLGTIVVIGALLFLPALALGPIAEHLGPMPFGG